MQNFFREMRYSAGRFLPPAVMYIITINIAAFILYILFAFWSERTMRFFELFMQTPYQTVQKFFLWQPLTYMFMHASFLHLLINMFILGFFGRRLEDRWGTARFVRFYMLVGIGAAVIHIIACYLTKHQDTTMLGASGAIYGIMVAYALYWPDDIIYLYFVIPVKIKHLVLIAGLLAFMGSFQSAMGQARDNISHVTHLGGIVVALIYLRGGKWLRRGPGKQRSPRSKTKHRSKRASIIEVDPRTHPDFRR